MGPDLLPLLTQNVIDFELSQWLCQKYLNFPEDPSYYDVSNNILGPKSAAFVHRVVICSVRQGARKWTFSIPLRVLVSQNWATLYIDGVSVAFSDKDVDGDCADNKKT